MKKRLFFIWKCWNNMTLKHRLILLNFPIIIFTTLIITTVMLNYSKNIISENSTVLIQDSIKQINSNIDEMLKGQIYAVSKFIMYDDDIYAYLARYNNETYENSRQKEVDTYLIREKVLKQYFIHQEHIDLAAIINHDDVIYNLSYPVNEEGIVKYYIDNTIRKDKTIKDLKVRWYPLTYNVFTKQDDNPIRRNNVVIANRNIIKASTGKFVGEQIYTIHEEAIYEKYRDSEIVKDGVIFIIDKKGNLISHTQVEKVESKSLDHQSHIVREVLNHPNKEFFISEDKTLVIQETLNDGNWITIAVLPNDSIYKDISRIYFLFILLMVALLIFAGIGITMISDRIVKPIKKIIKSMEEVEKGNLDVNVQISGQYEVSKLAKYYNNMIMRINRLIEEEYILEQKKKTAELDALMAQINPHFLYNTLESIVWKARAIGSEDISNMAYSLGKFFRISVNRGKIIVPVKEELDHVRAYVNIQKIRYGNKFDLIVQLEDDYIQEYKTLKLILQPIVENAIMYGIEPLEGPGYIKITVEEDNNHLLFRVEDNGKGMSRDKLEQLISELNKPKEGSNKPTYSNDVKKDKGIGLSNVQERIKLYFGHAYGIKVHSILGEGTIVTIIMPLID